MSDELRSIMRKIYRKEGLLRGHTNAMSIVRSTFRDINNQVKEGKCGIDEIVHIQRFSTACLQNMEREQRTMEKDLDKDYREMRAVEPMEI